jgi:hypothetical protein
MKTNQTNNAAVGGNFGNACRECGQKVLARLRETKAAILAEARETVKARERLLTLALNEAEALAWQTWYPHLLFPALAAEKLQDVARWNRRQSLLRGQTRPGTV